MSRNIIEDQLKKVEAILFAANEPISAARIANLIKSNANEVHYLIDELKERLKSRNSALAVIESGGGFRLYTKPEHREIVLKASGGFKRSKLSRAALETLAIIAYKQPVTRTEIQKIRGVFPESSLSTLLEYDLIEAVKEGGEYVYKTTKRFLELTGLKSLSGLPKVDEN